MTRVRGLVPSARDHDGDATNPLNQDIQRHVFGDIIKRSVVGEIRLVLRSRSAGGRGAASKLT
jgi:hypothetical protein